MVKGLSDLMVYFFMNMALYNVWPQHIEFFDCLMLHLRQTKPLNSIIMFDIQCLCKSMDHFFVLGFLVDTDGLGVIRLLLVHPSDVEIISASIIFLYCCQPSHSTAVCITYWCFQTSLFKQRTIT